MRIEFIAAAALVLGGLVVPCGAQTGCDDCTTTFTLNSSFIQAVGGSGTGTIEGTLTLDTTTDLFTDADLTVSGFGYTGSYALTDITDQSDVDDVYEVEIEALNLFIPTGTLAGYTGSSICSNASSCYAVSDFVNDSSGEIYRATSGSLEPEVATTPEPGSLLLLATGLLGLVGLGWRRFA